MSLDSSTAADVRERVRARYAEAALRATEGQAACCGPSAGEPAAGGSSCCGPVDPAEVFGSGHYGEADRGELPDAAVLASLGCGNPLVVADLHPGEVVLDLGSGGGIDVLLSARRVGPTGRAYGLDMTDEMLELARRNAAEAGATNVQFLQGHIEDIPLPDASVDVVISNCVINLSADKAAVFAEMHRVLRAGGRIGISDVIADDDLDAAQRAERGEWTGCIAGALSEAEYRQGLSAAGFTDIDVTFTHAVADGMRSAGVRAVKPT